MIILGISMYLLVNVMGIYIYIMIFRAFHVSHGSFGNFHVSHYSGGNPNFHVSKFPSIS